MLKEYRKVLRTVLIAVIILGLLAPASVPDNAVASRANPELLQIAQESPAQWIRVIVQKSDSSNRAEALVERLGGVITKDLHLINAFAAELLARDLVNLSKSVSVQWVSLDAPVIKMETGDDDNECDDDEVGGLCENYFLDTLGVRKVWEMGYQGQGITVAIIDSGIQKDWDFSHLLQREKFNPDSNSINDFYGHGTHVAGIIGGNGNTSKGRYVGVAPGVNLIGLKVSDERGRAYESDTVEALEWVHIHKDKYNIRVVNLSVNSSVEGSYHDSPLAAAVEILWLNGVVVVVSSGNTDSSTSFNPVKAAPANDPFVITVGASDEKLTADLSDDVLTSFSARGQTQDGYLKPEIVAPGRNIISVLSQSSSWEDKYEDRAVWDDEYIRLSGTSMSAPMVAGAAALLLQAEPNLTPDQVKYRLVNTAGNLEGFPYLNVHAALTTKTSDSANQGIVPHMLLAKMAMIAYWSYEAGGETCDWENIDWASVNWNSIDWASVNWDSINWDTVNWDSVNWNSVNWNAVNWNSVNWNSVNWNSVNWNSVNWNSVNWNSVNWNSVQWNGVIRDKGK
jgi:serine protease AprX